MFGMGFTEILIIAIIAVLFLGPDKLPEAMVEIAKFFRSVKKTVSSAKDALNDELHMSEIKEEALNYKKELTSASSELGRMTDMTEVGSEISGVKEAAKVDLNETPEATAKKAPVTPEVVTFAKKPKPESSEEDA